jgi:hypothetical protein
MARQALGKSHHGPLRAAFDVFQGASDHKTSVLSYTAALLTGGRRTSE